MKRRFILYRRKRGGMFYLEDTETHKQETTSTRNRAEATALLNARNESFRQPQLNLQIAKAYLAGTDAGLSKRTWQDAFTAITENKHGPTQERWQRAIKQKAFDLILPLIIIETQAEQLFACLKAGTVSTNVHLRELHNFCIGMNWLTAHSPCNVRVASGYDDSIPEFSVKLIVNRSDVPPVSTFPVLSQPADQDWLHEISGRETPHSPRRVFGCIVIM